MRYILVFLALFSFLACAERTPAHQLKTNAERQGENFDWLLGSWLRKNDEKGKKTYETWQRNEKNEYIGLGCTLDGQDTVFQEQMRLYNTGEQWVLEVSGVNEAPTLFTLTEIKTASFVCENEAHDFPKKIEYWKAGTQLSAAVSGDGMEIPFEFEPLKD